MSDVVERLLGVANRNDRFQDDATLVSRKLLREAATTIVQLGAQVERMRTALNGIRQAYVDAPGWANPTPTTELVHKMYSLALMASLTSEKS
jgi:hypothetical protein